MSGRRRGTWFAVAIGGLLSVVVALPALASPTAKALSTPASVTGSAVTAIGTLTVQGQNLTVAPGPSTGTFSVNGDLLPVSLPGLTGLNTLASFTFKGPITCLDVSGHRAGLIYPVTTATGPVGSAFKGLAVDITIQDNGPGQPEQVGFLGPAPINSLKTCPPLVPFLTVQSGRIVVTPAH